MSEIRRRFIQFQGQYPALGDVIIMCYVVKGQNYSRPMIDKAFNELVSKEEFDKDEKSELVDFLLNQTLTK